MHHIDVCVCVHLPDLPDSRQRGPLLPPCMCVRVSHMFVRLKGLARHAPFVVGRSGLPTRLVWFMDVSQSCNSLRPERGCPSSRCETPADVPTLTSIKQELIRASNLCLPRAVSPSIHTTAAHQISGWRRKYDACIRARFLRHGSRCHVPI